MKILLINPPYPFEECPAPPFGLMSLAAYLLREGFDVRIEDYIVEPYTPDRARHILDEFGPDIVGATAVTMNVKKAISILSDFRTKAKGIITMIGGPHATFDPEGMLRSGCIDFVVRGEGEVTATELLRSIEAGKNGQAIAGVSFITGNEITHNDDRPFIADINTLPYPARHLVQLSKYRAMNFPVNMMTSRGCPHSCIFCVGHRMVGNRVRYFDVDRVVDEFEMLSKLGFKQINIVDDLFTSNKKRCMEICDGIINRGIKHRWSAFARVDTVNAELLEKLHAAGCADLCFGIESGNQEILDKIKKRTTLDKCRHAAELCLEKGIKPMASYILGLPGETEETVRKTFEFAENMAISYGFHILAPFPGTEVRNRAEEYGMKIMTSDWDMYDANRSVCSTGGISPERIDSIANEFNSKISSRINELSNMNRRGETLSATEREIIDGLESFLFSRKLITGKLLENFRWKGNSKNSVLQGFTSYITENTGLTEPSAEKEIQRLIDLGCIEEKQSGDSVYFCWRKDT